MTPPAYHLRLNKAVDRFMLIDILRCFAKDELKSYRYVGLGAPFLEDFKLLEGFFPTLRKVSFELDRQTFLRQKFNRPSRLVHLEHGDMVEKMGELTKDDKPLIVWYDSTQATEAIFEGFISIIDAVPTGSVVRVTMRLGKRDPAPNKKLIGSLTQALRSRISTIDGLGNQKEILGKDIDRIVKEQVEGATAQYRELESISRYRPLDYLELLKSKNGLAKVIFKAIHQAVVETFPVGCGRMFRLLNASCYSDNTKMLSVTGVVLSETEEASFMKRFKGTGFESTKWSDELMQIDMPILTPKERLHLNVVMPVVHNAGKRLSNRLGFSLDPSAETAEKEMEMYNRFYRYYPMFAKVVL